MKLTVQCPDCDRKTLLCEVEIEPYFRGSRYEPESGGVIEDFEVLKYGCDCRHDRAAEAIVDIHPVNSRERLKFFLAWDEAKASYLSDVKEAIRIVIERNAYD